MTHKCINQLAIEILGIERGDTVVENCMGIGSFIAEASKVQPDASYCGVEINHSVAAIAEMRLSLVKSDCHVVTGNALEDNFCGKQFNKGFSNYPFGMRIRTVSEDIGIIERINKTTGLLVLNNRAKFFYAFVRINGNIILF